MKFPLLDAHPREHKIEVHRGGWLRERGFARGCGAAGVGDDYYGGDGDGDVDDENYTQKLLTTKRIDGNKFIIVEGVRKSDAPSQKKNNMYIYIYDIDRKFQFFICNTNEVPLILRDFVC